MESGGGWRRGGTSTGLDPDHLDEHKYDKGALYYCVQKYFRCPAMLCMASDFKE